MGAVRRIGVLTGGGDCPGLNAVIRAVVKTATTYYEWEVIGIEDGFEGLIKEGKTHPLTNETVRGILPRGGTILGSTNRGNPFAYRERKEGEVTVTDLSRQVIDRCERLRLDALLVIGGDGSLGIANDFFKLGVPVVGIPKTIDNDLSATDVTFGFDTALNTATEAIDKLHTTAESHHRVMVLEVMGRHAGWIALEAGLAGGGDIILIPELPFQVDRVVEQIRRRDASGRSFSIVVVAEGAAPAGVGLFTIEPRDPLARARLGGIGDWLADQVGQRTEHEVRSLVLGHLQRGGSPTPRDRILGTRFGVEAVRLASREQFGHMVALRGTEIVAVTLDEAVGVLKTVPPESALVHNARCLGVSFGDES
ncbi:MAG: 6-phosphofructokinase [Chloroflexi bacterium]|nr:6-phosphofructokinase [Chloroflexota bacterium]